MDPPPPTCKQVSAAMEAIGGVFYYPGIFLS